MQSGIVFVIFRTCLYSQLENNGIPTLVLQCFEACTVCWLRSSHTAHEQQNCWSWGRLRGSFVFDAKSCRSSRPVRWVRWWDRCWSTFLWWPFMLRSGRAWRSDVNLSSLVDVCWKDELFAWSKDSFCTAESHELKLQMWCLALAMVFMSSQSSNRLWWHWFVFWASCSGIQVHRAEPHFWCSLVYKRL